MILAAREFREPAWCPKETSVDGTGGRRAVILTRWDAMADCGESG
ncbi:MAG: hypothetical protein ACODAD_15770 [Planctomycetota bacterium]